MKYKCDSCAYVTIDYKLMDNHRKTVNHPSYHKVNDAVKLDVQARNFLIGKYSERVNFATDVANAVIKTVEMDPESRFAVEVYHVILDKILTPMIYLMNEEAKS